MHGLPADLIKYRDIRFCVLHPEPDQALAAMRELEDAEGILRLQPDSPMLLNVTYDVSRITLCIIEGTLSDLGFHLDNSLMCRLRRALYYYTEDTQRTNLGCVEENHTRKIFIERYCRRPRGCRDDRPSYWRKYW